MNLTPTIRMRAERLEACLRDVQFCFPLCARIFLEMGTLLTTLENDAKSFRPMQEPVTEARRYIQAVCEIIDSNTWPENQTSYIEALTSVSRLRQIVVQELQ